MSQICLIIIIIKYIYVVYSTCIYMYLSKKNNNKKKETWRIKQVYFYVIYNCTCNTWYSKIGKKLKTALPYKVTMTSTWSKLSVQDKMLIC